MWWKQMMFWFTMIKCMSVHSTDEWIKNAWMDEWMTE